MHTFKVVQEPHGWAVRLGSGMSAPFRSRALAVQEAHCLCERLRRHGETAEVVVEEPELDSRELSPDRFAGDRLRSLLRALQRTQGVSRILS